MEVLLHRSWNMRLAIDQEARAGSGELQVVRSLVMAREAQAVRGWETGFIVGQVTHA